MTAPRLLAALLAGLALIDPLIFSQATKDSFILKETVAALLILSAWTVAASAGLRCGPGALGWPILAWLGAGLLSFVNSADWVLSGRALFFMGLWASCYWLGRMVSEGWSLRIFRAAVLAGLAASVYGLAQHVGLDPLDWATTFEGRPTGTMGNPDFLAGYLVAALPAALMLAWHGEKMGVAAAVAMFAALVLAQTRGAWIAVAGGLASFAALQGLPKKGLKTAVAAAVVLLIVLGPRVAGRARAMLSPAESSRVERIFKWETALEMVRDHPALGVGLGTLKTYFATYQWKVKERWAAEGHPIALRGTSESNVHNEYLQTAAQTGLLGFAAFLWLWAATLIMLWRRRADPLAAAAGAGLVGILLYSLTNFPLQSEPTACWGFLSLGLAEGVKDEREGGMGVRAVLRTNSGVTIRGLSFVGARAQPKASAPQSELLASVPGSPYSRAIVCALIACSAGWFVVLPPFRAEIHRQRAGVAAAAGDWMNAEREARSAIALCRERSEKTAFDLGEMLRRRGRWEEALDAYRLSIRLRNYGEVYNSRANCFYILWARDHARAECRDEAVRLWRVAARLGLPRPEDQAAVEQNLRVIDRATRQVLPRS